MKKSFKININSILGYSLLGIILLLIISIISIFGGALMKLFGFQYKSIGSIILFFTIVTIVGFPIELLAKTLPKALLSLNRITPKTEKILFIILDTISSSIVMAIIDYFMDSVSCSDLAIFIVAFVFSFASYEKNEDVNL